ncbi:MAG: hypothetical protein ABSB41_03975 [Anaerolineales bacterium]|jgi:predicted  nucleic acid-binding Zn-ribbon protein
MTKLELLEKKVAEFQTALKAESAKLETIKAEHLQLDHISQTQAQQVAAQEYIIGHTREKLAEVQKAIEEERARLDSPEVKAARKEADKLDKELKAAQDKIVATLMDARAQVIAMNDTSQKFAKVQHVVTGTGDQINPMGMTNWSQYREFITFTGPALEGFYQQGAAMGFVKRT